MPKAIPTLKSFWNQPSRYKVLYGGRASGKSWDTAIRALYLAQREKLRFLCTRKFQNRIEESVYSLLKDQIRRLGYQNEFTILNNKIIHNVTGSEFLFYGLARNVQEIKSLEGVDILWNEESHSISKEDFEEILEPTIRKDHSEIWFIFNPDLETDYVYQRFVLNPPEDAVVRKINYEENRFLNDTILKVINDLKERDYDAYEHIYLGFPKKNDESAIIKRSWVEACIDAHVKLDVTVDGEKIIGYDPADSGEDTNAISYKHGNLITDTWQWHGKEDELFKSCQKVYNEAIKGYHVNYDSVGVGAGVGSNLKQMEQPISYSPFNAGGSVIKPDKEYKYGVKNKDHFSNLKAQMWFNVADRMMATYNAIQKGEHIDNSEILSISSECANLQSLITELSTPKKDYDGKGRVKVESKQDLAKRGVKSPNLADSFVMCFSPNKKQFTYAL